MDFIYNGQGTGNVAGRLINNGFNPNVLRPYLNKRGQACMTIVENGKPKQVVVSNAEATLRKEDWKTIDRAVLKASQPRFKAFNYLRSSGLTYSIPNGMAKTVLESESVSDITDATIDMDGLAEGQRDRPAFDLENLPLPIIHKDFSYSARQLAASRYGNGSPLDTTHAELAGRKVAEAIEQLYLGTFGTYRFGGGSVWGLTNFPKRITTSLTMPDGTNQKTTLNEILAMRDLAKDQHHYGPFALYFGTAWDRFLDDDYSTEYPGVTLKDRLEKVTGIDMVDTLDFLPGFQAVLVEKSTDTVRAVLGMDLTTVQWESKGGMQVNFKVMAIMVPQLRADFHNNCGIVHATTN